MKSPSATTIEGFLWVIAACVFLLLSAQFTTMVEAWISYEEIAGHQQANGYVSASREREISVDRIAAHDEVRVEEKNAEAPVTLAEPQELNVSDEPLEVEAIPSETELYVEPPAPKTEEAMTVAPVTKEEVVIEDAPTKESFAATVAKEVHRLTNVERERRGLAALSYDVQLERIAQAHSADMQKNDYFEHVSEDGCDMECRLQDGGYDASMWAENIAWREQTPPPSAEAFAAHFVKSWMESPGHKMNILSKDVTHEGVGIVRVGDSVYATVDFAVPK